MLPAQINFQASLLEGQGEKVAQYCHLTQTPGSAFTMHVYGALSYKMRTSSVPLLPLDSTDHLRTSHSSDCLIASEM